jgi:hypothetical protein
MMNLFAYLIHLFLPRIYQSNCFVFANYFAKGFGVDLQLLHWEQTSKILLSNYAFWLSDQIGLI